MSPQLSLQLEMYGSKLAVPDLLEKPAALKSTSQWKDFFHHAHNCVRNDTLGF